MTQYCDVPSRVLTHILLSSGHSKQSFAPRNRMKALADRVADRAGYVPGSARGAIDPAELGLMTVGTGLGAAGLVGLGSLGTGLVGDYLTRRVSDGIQEGTDAALATVKNAASDAASPVTDTLGRVAGGIGDAAGEVSGLLGTIASRFPGLKTSGAQGGGISSNDLCKIVASSPGGRAGMVQSLLGRMGYVPYVPPKPPSRVFGASPARAAGGGMALGTMGGMGMMAAADPTATAAAFNRVQDSLASGLGSLQQGASGMYGDLMGSMSGVGGNDALKDLSPEADARRLMNFADATSNYAAAIPR